MTDKLLSATIIIQNKKRIWLSLLCNFALFAIPITPLRANDTTLILKDTITDTAIVNPSVLLIRPDTTFIQDTSCNSDTTFIRDTTTIIPLPSPNLQPTPTHQLQPLIINCLPFEKISLPDSIGEPPRNKKRKNEQINNMLLSLNNKLKSALKDSTITIMPVLPQQPVMENFQPIDQDSTDAYDLFDSLMANVDTTTCLTDAKVAVAQLPDSILIKRLQNLQFDIEMPYHKTIVRNFITNYVDRNPKRLSTLLSQADSYFPLFDDIIAQYHHPYDKRSVPYEIRYLAVIESALNPFARSRMGACGLWQFMPTTAKLHGLEVNSLVDERFDPIKATHAACTYLQELYDLFEDWNLAIAAYNCGPGNIKKAITRSGGKRDFWSIYPFLPRETRGYLPIFIAACYALNYAEEHGICHPSPPQNNNRDTLQIQKRVHLQQIANVINIDMKTLRQLNPQYTKDIIPGNKNYTLILPDYKTTEFISMFDSICSYKADELINNRRKEIDILQKTGVSGYYSINGVTYYKIRKGDNLGSIARKFHCSVKQIKAWNGLSSDFIRAGKTLKIKK